MPVPKQHRNSTIECTQIGASATVLIGSKLYRRKGGVDRETWSGLHVVYMGWDTEKI